MLNFWVVEYTVIAIILNTLIRFGKDTPKSKQIFLYSIVTFICIQINTHYCWIQKMLYVLYTHIQTRMYTDIRLDVCAMRGNFKSAFWSSFVFYLAFLISKKKSKWERNVFFKERRESFTYSLSLSLINANNFYTYKNYRWWEINALWR